MITNASRTSILVLTSTFPRWKADVEPPFVHELARRDRDLVFDGSLEAGIRSAASAEVLATMLREKGFTHVIIQNDLFDKFILSRLSVDRLTLFQTFIINHTKSLFSEGGHILFEFNG